MRPYLLIGLAFLAAAPAALAQTETDETPRATARSIDIKPAPSTATSAPASAAAAAAAEPEPDADQRTLKPQQLFISPMGEPFRAPPGQAYPVAQWFQGADTDHDGSISLEEFKADAMRFFKVLDQNGDGIIDGFEAQDYETKIAPEILPRVTDVLTARDVMTQHELAESGHQRRRPEDSVGMGSGRGSRSAAQRDAMSGAAIYGLLVDAEPVRSTDMKLDYHITREEWLAAAARRFAELDKDHTGKLELAKLPQTPLQKAIDERRRHESKEAKGKSDHVRDKS
jgi:hypothetical protein